MPLSRSISCLGDHDGALARCRNSQAFGRPGRRRIRPDGPRGCDAPLGTGPYILAVATVILSWVFTHTVFALHYAYEFYGEG
jgi:hypothetical protein